MKMGAALGRAEGVGSGGGEGGGVPVEEGVGGMRIPGFGGTGWIGISVGLAVGDGGPGGESAAPDASGPGEADAAAVAAGEGWSAGACATHRDELQLCE